MDKRLERILKNVQKPARYTGGEYGEIKKDLSEVDTRIAFCFPDTYEIGMSNLGLKILYGIFNSMPGVWCERAFAPWGDMEEQMRANCLPLWGLESGDPVGTFDMIAFSVGYEMAYTGVLNMLDLACVPLLAADRNELFPIVAVGGTCAYNPEPLADFVDIFFIGEGEDSGPEVVELYRKARREGLDKPAFLKAAAQIKGVYVPSLYQVSYNDDGTVADYAPLGGAPAKAEKRIVQDFDKSYFPVKTIVPSTEIVHDRVVLELFRGCIRGCRFCQAGYVYRPVRHRGADTLCKQAREAVDYSGWQEISLASLSTSDYRGLGPLCDGILSWGEDKNVSVSLPSLRADNFSMEIMKRVQKVRKSGLTFAPEAGTQRLRDAINKNVTEEDLLIACRIAFGGGWNSVKLYFMLGLPTETDEDVLGIADLAYKVLRTWKESAVNKSRGVRITVSTSCFVPKPMTPFQWEAQDTAEEFDRKQKLLRDNMRTKAITYNWHDPKTSFIEAVLARGDRRLGRVLLEVWRNGGKLDGWSEYFSFERYMDAFKACGTDPAFYANRERNENEVFPWDVISDGVKKEYLAAERAASRRFEITPDCRTACTGCGADALYEKGVCDEEI